MLPLPAMRAGRTGSSIGRLLGFLLLFLLIGPTSSQGVEPEKNPLAPPDTSSPRATIQTFSDSMRTAVDLFQRGDEGFDDPLTDAVRCLDVNELPQAGRDVEAVAAAVLLKEILDRIELPRSRNIPDAEQAREENLERWTIPNTEITLVRVEEGPAKGSYVFNTETVLRAEEFYDKVSTLPYKPGMLGASREEMLRGAGDMIPSWIVANIPDSLEINFEGLPIWKWLATILVGFLLVATALALHLLGKRLAANWPVLGRAIALLAPLAVLTTARLSDDLIRGQLLISGAPAVGIDQIATAVQAFGLAWLLIKMIGWGADFLISRSTYRPGAIDTHMIRLTFRLLSAAAVVVIVLRTCQELGIPLAAVLTGFGVGGVAIALAAQNTIENLIGGITLFADRPVRVGDFCRFGKEVGTVEEIGLRSTRIRTLARSIVTVPNAQFARLHIENLASRDRILLRDTVKVRWETGPDALRRVLEGIRTMILAHERMANDPVRVRLITLGQYAFEIEIYAYAATSVWEEFLEIREDVLLRALDVLQAEQVQLAHPRTTYVTSDETTPA